MPQMIQWFDNTLAHFINNTPAPLSVSALDHLQQKPNISQNKNGALGSLSAAYLSRAKSLLLLHGYGYLS